MKNLKEYVLRQIVVVEVSDEIRKMVECKNASSHFIELGLRGGFNKALELSHKASKSDIVNVYFQFGT